VSQKTKETASHSVLLKLSIASILRRFEFEREALAMLISHLPDNHTRQGLSQLNAELIAAIDKAKEIKA